MSIPNILKGGLTYLLQLSIHVKNKPEPVQVNSKSPDDETDNDVRSDSSNRKGPDRNHDYTNPVSKKNRQFYYQPMKHCLTIAIAIKVVHNQLVTAR